MNHTTNYSTDFSTDESSTDSSSTYEDGPFELDRGETGRRIVYTLVFSVIASITQTVLTTLVVFQLGFALITQREPGPELRHFANHALSYLVRIYRYMTYNDACPPFPFREFPDELDLDRPLRSET